MVTFSLDETLFSTKRAFLVLVEAQLENIFLLFPFSFILEYKTCHFYKVKDDYESFFQENLEAKLALDAEKQAEKEKKLQVETNC